MATTRVFQSGNSQAVRLPKGFRFSTLDVEILLRGGDVILREPRRSLRAAFELLARLPADGFTRGRRER